MAELPRSGRFESFLRTSVTPELLQRTACWLADVSVNRYHLCICAKLFNCFISSWSRLQHVRCCMHWGICATCVVTPPTFPHPLQTTAVCRSSSTTEVCNLLLFILLRTRTVRRVHRLPTVRFERTLHPRRTPPQAAHRGRSVYARIFFFNLFCCFVGCWSFSFMKNSSDKPTRWLGSDSNSSSRSCGRFRLAWMTRWNFVCMRLLLNSLALIFFIGNFSFWIFYYFLFTLLQLVYRFLIDYQEVYFYNNRNRMGEIYF